jgi:GNAT superfamily N-acetyltransferase
VDAIEDEETTEHCVIHDRAGRRFRVEIESSPIQLSFDVYDRDWSAGHAWCMPEGDVLKLHDIDIKNGIPLPESGFARILRRIFRSERPTYDYRKRGLGTVLLQLVIATAKHKGFSRIEGYIVEDDAAANPSLFDWYRRHGFVVREEREIRNQVASIALDLD